MEKKLLSSFVNRSSFVRPKNSNDFSIEHLVGIKNPVLDTSLLEL